MLTNNLEGLFKIIDDKKKSEVSLTSSLQRLWILNWISDHLKECPEEFVPLMNAANRVLGKESAMKNILYIFICFLTISACGQGTNLAPNGTAPSLGAIPSSSSTEVGTGTQVNQDVNISAKMYLTEDQLPKCTESLYRELVYVKDSKQFFYCDTDWTAIDLKGAKGDQGVQGVQGVQGNQGIAGINGKDGANATFTATSTNTSPAASSTVVTSSYIWVHPVNGTRWFLGATIDSIKNGPNPTDNDNTKNPVYFCPQGSRLPTGTEYADAIRAGVWNFFHGLYPSLQGFSLGIGDFKDHYYGNGGLITYNIYYSIIGLSDGEISHVGTLPLSTLCIVGN